jgi:hypothetical protein
MEGGGGENNKEGEGSCKRQRGGQRKVLGWMLEKQGVLVQPTGLFPCGELFLQIINVKFCNVHNVLYTVVSVKP